MKRHLLLLIALLIWSAPAWAEEPSHDQTWQQANTAYINNDFRTAISLYEQILADSVHSSRLYYNLANAYFKEQQTGRAILNYHRALRLSPGDADARYNLMMAERLTRGMIDPLPEFPPKVWLRRFRGMMSENAWTELSLAGVTLTLGAALLYLLSRRMTWRKTGFYGTLVMLLLSIVSICFALRRHREQQERPEAIVMHESVAMKSAPDSASTDLFILYEGLQVHITQRLEGWSEITIPSGDKGWIENDDLEAI